MAEGRLGDPGVYVIAEAGLNHNGDIGLARELISAASEAGADAVKFQTFKTDLFLSSLVPDREQRRGLEFTEAQWSILASYASEVGIDFISTPLDHESLALLLRLQVKAIKIASGDITNHALLRDAARSGKTLLVSTGMASLGEIEKALSVIREQAGADADVVLLHCVSEYPAPEEHLNLRVLRTLQEAFKVRVGLSDHSLGTEVAPIAATALGASVIEKHFTLDKTLPGYDHHMSVTPDEFRQMVLRIRATEAALGSGVKGHTEAERVRQPKARRGLYWIRDYPAGQVVSEDMVISLRPVAGVGAEWIDAVTGCRLRRPVRAGEPVSLDDLEGCLGRGSAG